LNLPPSYLMIHRVTFGSIGVLCQLDATAPFREIVVRWQPGFADPDGNGNLELADAHPGYANIRSNDDEFGEDPGDTDAPTGTG